MSLAFSRKIHSESFVSVTFEWLSNYEFWRGVKSPVVLRIQRLSDGKEPVIMAASYVLVSAGDDVDFESALNELLASFDIGSLWVEKCPGFGRMVAIHFDLLKEDKFDRLISAANEVGLHASPDYMHVA
mmetsp:Transcript_30413/g.41646  ORF Transcript_30413/g.41646 Transcript_30413/m.41646 type:complete len:129 (+) Transcript_30413:410-796(+)